MDRRYVEQSSNLNNRMIDHNRGESLLTSTGIPWILLCSTEKSSLRVVEDIEFRLKNLNRGRKIKFMRKHPEEIHDLGL